MWFVAVDRSAWYEECQHCRSHRIRVATRAFGVVLSCRFHSEREEFGACIARDLGCPCPHDYAELLVARYRGFVLPSNLKNLPYHLSEGIPHWYSKNVSAIVHGLKTEDPSIGEEFRDRVFLMSDYDYMRQVIQKMRRYLSAEDAKKFDRESR